MTDANFRCWLSQLHTTVTPADSFNKPSPRKQVDDFEGILGRDIETPGYIGGFYEVFPRLSTIDQNPDCVASRLIEAHG